MKKIVLSVLASLSLLASQAQTKNSIVITGTKFTYPLIEKWIAGYQKVHPEVSIKLLDKGQEGVDKANVRIASYDVYKAGLKENEVAIPVSRYALLPVASQQSPLALKLQKKGIKPEELKKLFLEDPEESLDDKKPEAPYQIYTRSAKVCSSITFANYLGSQPDDIVGKGITGDDKHLIEAIKRDSLGITYNNLGYIYDVQSRNIAKGLTVLPIDLNENGKLDKDEQIYQNLDVLLGYLAKNPNVQSLPVEKVYFVVNGQQDNEAFQSFVQWIHKEGQSYNQALGFLEVGEITTQRASIDAKRATNK